MLLAHLPAAQRRALLDQAGLTAFTDKTVSVRRTLEAQLAAVCTDGYATTLEEYEEGLNAIAAPIHDFSGAVVAAISVSGPAYRIGRRRLREMAAPVVGAGRAISHRMGFLG